MNLSVSDLLIIIPVIFISMAVHEAMHAFTAHWLGDTTAQDMGRLTLNPLKHIDLMTTVFLPVILILMQLPPIFAAKPVPFNPDRVKYDEFGAALIGIAGPLTNLALAIVGAFILRLYGGSGLIGDILYIFVIINVSFFVFNMIPFPPLDGSRLLYAFAPEPLQNVMLTIERMGFTSILFFFVLITQVPAFGAIISNTIDAVIKVLLGV